MANTVRYLKGRRSWNRLGECESITDFKRWMDILDQILARKESSEVVKCIHAYSAIFHNPETCIVNYSDVEIFQKSNCTYIGNLINKKTIVFTYTRLIYTYTTH